MLRATSILAATLLAAAVLGSASAALAADGRTLNVPADYPGVAEAIAASQPGDVILLAAGTYPGDVVVPDDRPGITIRGVDRNLVVFDGANTRANAIEVEADDVMLENMSAHDFVENGFYWEGVEGFAGRYLTVWNVGLYAIYTIESRDGVIEDSYASGAADAAFYIGECNPCDTVVRRVVAELSAVGYSGTNAGGNLVLEDSRFENNGIGILPNSFDVGLEPPPQRDAIFRRNTVLGTGSVPTPRNTPLGGYFGVGIGIAGGTGNLVEANTVERSATYGIALFTTLDVGTQWVSAGNRITANTVSGSGSADLGLAAGSGAGNCFEGNTAGTLLPAGLAGCSAAGAGDDAVAADLSQPPPQLLGELPPAPDYETMPVPPAQASMPAETPVAEDQSWLRIGAVAITVLAAAAVVAWVALARRRRGVGGTRG